MSGQEQAVESWVRVGKVVVSYGCVREEEEEGSGKGASVRCEVEKEEERGAGATNAIRDSEVWYGVRFKVEWKGTNDRAFSS